MRMGMEHVVPSVIRVATYNVLSPKYAVQVPQNPIYNQKVLDPSSRLCRIQQSLEAEVEMGSVIALQELSMQWLGPMHKWMRERDYYLVAGQYGPAKSGYMGVALAIPSSMEIIDLHVNTVSSTRKWGFMPRPGIIEEMMKSARRLMIYVKSFLPSVQKELEITILTSVRMPIQSQEGKLPMQEPFLASKRRSNQMIFARLRTKDESVSSGKDFCVATYHMPCAFYDPRIMAIHTALVCQHAQRLAGLDRLILAGDFNFKPMEPCYRLVTKGVLPEGSAALPNFPEWVTKADPNWKLEIERPMSSAYADVQGTEPEFTTWAYSFVGGEFKDTLDYIFYCGKGLVPKEVLRVPSSKGIVGPFPNAADEASDHLLLATTFELHEK